MATATGEAFFAALVKYLALALGTQGAWVTEYLDILGFLGLSPTVREGYQGIRVTMRVKSDAPAEKLAALCQFSQVFDTISNPVPVTVNVEKQ